ncbi:MAG TPA: D-alanyl-D-alanine carboxypeptidase/D-alanyl-D-alanine-endopeptidase [Alphaproteobacteria bacterium]|nr:D-alanyl-D-alanine carboxypeptidase/D-alanyl-D-alanine-endopeptidase [Alphaproteobacteria bacterium]
MRPLAVSILLSLLPASCNNGISSNQPIPGEILQIFEKPIYQDAIWGLRVVDLDTGQILYDLRPDYDFLIGSVRKLFSVGLTINELGADHRFRTPVHRGGDVDGAGVLHGDLILVASGDLTMGGRTNPDGSIAITDFDHNEANSLGNAELTAPDPLSGYHSLAQQVAASGITHIDGDVIIDDRLFVPFNFRGEFDVRPIFVNDDVVDVVINPTTPGALASVSWRPMSAAFRVASSLVTAPAGEDEEVELDPELPGCIGLEGCAGTVAGRLPVDFAPPHTNQFPLVQTFRIVEPANYARTIFIEALEEAGVTVSASLVGPNPVDKLPPANSYTPDTLVAELVSLPYSDFAKLILKVSYNIGADTSLVLFGLTQGADNLDDALAVERQVLTTNFGIDMEDFFFVDGSGGGFTTATNVAVSRMLAEISQRPSFSAYRDALPVLGVDGSLAFVTDFEADPTLAGAKGKVRAKTGTFIEGTETGLNFRAQALAGYIAAKSGRRLAFTMAVNDVGPLTSIDEVLEVFQDQGKISAIVWRDN